MRNLQRGASRRRALNIERLEDRRVLAAVQISTDTDEVDWDFGSQSSDFVNHLINNPGADGEISLREAVIATNLEENVGGPDEITFDPSVFPATSTHQIQLGNSQGEIDITDALTITGPGQGVLTIIADTNSRIFSIAVTPAAAATKISGLTPAGQVHYTLPPHAFAILRLPCETE